jgi:hypothetical protein
MPDTEELEEMREVIQPDNGPVRGSVSVDEDAETEETPAEEAVAGESEVEEKSVVEPAPKERIKVQIPDEDGGYHEKEYEPEELGRRHANATQRIRDLQRELEEARRRPEPQSVMAPSAGPSYKGMVQEAQVEAWAKSYEDLGYDSDQARRYAETWAARQAEEARERQRQEQGLQSVRQELEMLKQEKILMAVTAELQRERPDFQPFSGDGLKPEYQRIIDEVGNVNIRGLYKVWSAMNPRSADAAKSRVAPTIGGSGGRKTSGQAPLSADAKEFKKMWFTDEDKTSAAYFDRMVGKKGK